ncbi:MAG: hypothetical protein AAGH89_09270 [Verrucomicrobiota bacterium]
MKSIGPFLSTALAFIAFPFLSPAETLEMREVVSDRDRAEIVLFHGKEELFLSEAVGITADDVVKAKALESSNGWQIFVTLGEKGAAKFADITKQALKERLAVIVDEKVVAAPRIQEVITGGELVVTGNFTETEANRLATELSESKVATHPEPQ